MGQLEEKQSTQIECVIPPIAPGETVTTVPTWIEAVRNRIGRMGKRYIALHYFVLGKSVFQAHHELIKIYQQGFSLAYLKKWYNEFQEGDIS